MFKKMIPVFLCVPLLFSVGCEKNAAVSPSEEKTTARVFANLDENYVPLKQAVIPSSLPEMSETEYPTSVTGEGVLYDDVTSSITVTVHDYTLEINVDGHTESISEETFIGANIVDLDTRDNLHELALYGEGPSADPSVYFLRFDGQNLYPIYHAADENGHCNIYGYFHSDETDVNPTYGAIWTNQKGAVVNSFGQIGFTNPRIALKRYVLENETWKQEELTPQFAETVLVAQDFKAYFTPEAEVPENYNNVKYFQNFSPENMRSFKKRQEIKILDYGKMYSYYAFFIEADGETGVIAFWLGD